MAFSLLEIQLRNYADVKMLASFAEFPEAEHLVVVVIFDIPISFWTAALIDENSITFSENKVLQKHFAVFLAALDNWSMHHFPRYHILVLNRIVNLDASDLFVPDFSVLNIEDCCHKHALLVELIVKSVGCHLHRQE